MGEFLLYFLGGMFGSELIQKIATRPFGFLILWLMSFILVSPVGWARLCAHAGSIIVIYLLVSCPVICITSERALGHDQRQVSVACAAAYKRPDWLTASKPKHRESTLWQRRYWEHQIRDETDFIRHVDYLH